MCCDDQGDGRKPDGVCKSCGEPVVEGRTTECCGCSPVECEECGWSPCDQSC